MENKVKVTEKYLTMLEAYKARIENISASLVVESITKGSGVEAAVVAGRVKLMAEMLRRRHQADNIIVRVLANGNYELIRGEVIVRAMHELNRPEITAILITCEDSEVEGIKEICSINDGPYPADVVIARFKEMKEAIKSTLREEKKAGNIEKYETNEVIADVVDTNLLYVKEVNNMVNEADGEITVVEGSTIGDVVSERLVKTPNEKVPTSIKLHCTKDYETKDDGLCPTCPAREAYHELLQLKREIQNKAA